MKTTEQIADELVVEHLKIDVIAHMEYEAIQHAILSTLNSIKVLERIKQTDKYNCKELHIPTQIELDEQTELLNELKTRL
jgi:hypothetical protein